MAVFNEEFISISAMIGRPDCGDLGYDLGYLRHGSFGRATARWPGRLRRVAACSPPCAGGLLYGLPTVTLARARERDAMPFAMPLGLTLAHDDGIADFERHQVLANLQRTVIGFARSRHDVINGCPRNLVAGKKD